MEEAHPVAPVKKAALPTAGGRYYRVVHKPRIAVRASPSVKGELVFAFPAGTVFHADEEESGWVSLARDELWVHQLKAGFVLVDGAQVGLGVLIEPVDAVTSTTWPYARAVQLAESFGVPFRVRDKDMRPPDQEKLKNSWLSSWHSQGSLSPVSWRPTLAVPAAPTKARPRLCVAMLLRGVPATVVESFLRYHHGIGFGRVALYFDAPDDPSEREAIEAAIAYSLDGPEVQVNLCDQRFWEEEKALSRFYLRRHQPDQSVYSDLLDLHERVRDVQARQCLAVEHAVRTAGAAGYDWLLHIDSDEVLLLPKWRDARDFFDSVPDTYDQVVFNNLEGIPESLEVQDWFKEVTLFKVHHSFLKESKDELPDNDLSPEGVQRRERRERWVQKKVAAGSDPEGLRKNRSFDRLAVGVRMARREVGLNFDFDLPAMDSDSEPDDDKEKAKDRLRNVLPSYYTAYANGKSAVRLRASGGPPLPIGVHRCTSDKNTVLSSYRCNGPREPVVLHYANCGYSAWLRKYLLLSKGHGTEDGGFSVTRKGINSMRAHLAHRDLTSRGSPEQLERYYRAFVMGNEFGELPHFACHGLLLRTRAVADLIATAEGAASGAEGAEAVGGAG